MTEPRRSRLPKPPRPADLARSLRKRDSEPSVDVEEAPGPTGPVIRRAVAKDITPVVALRALMFTAMGASTEAVSDNEWQAQTQRWLQVNLNNPLVNITVADVNGSAVACTFGEVVDRAPSPGNPQGAVGMLSNAATFPEYRQTGLGQACIDAIMEWFRTETSVTTVELLATPEGRRRYLKHGFADHPYPQMRVAIERPLVEA